MCSGPVLSTRRAMFSNRTSWNTSDSPWAKALAERRASGLPLHDLTIANPTDCGFDYSPRLLEILTNSAGLHYAADPFGLLQAREAICDYYREHRQTISSELVLHLEARQVLLTASTSEAYSFLFRLLCDPGDEVLIAQPGYPLFDLLADLDNIRLVSYPLFYDHGWHVDMHALKAKLTQRTRAIILVHPNNPTGHFTHQQSRVEVEQFAAANHLALIVDEVFLDYALAKPEASFVLGEHSALTFVLSGLSKVCGLPQMKLSWISTFGTQTMLTTALARLEVIADTFLSVSSPMQHALPVWLAGKDDMQQQILRRVRSNLAWLDSALSTHSMVNRLATEAGWYTVLRVPALGSGEETAVRLLTQLGIVVHPGGFFGMADSGWLVVSLLIEEDKFKPAIHRLLLGLETMAAHR